MKTLKIFLSALALLGVVGTARAGRIVYNGNLANETALAYNSSYTIDMGGNLGVPYGQIDNLSCVATYSSATIASQTFTDGVKSTGTLTISTITYSRTALIGARATAKLNVSDNTKIAGVAGTVTVNVASNTWLAANNTILTVNGNVVVSNRDYQVGAASNTTATNLASVINNWGGFTASASGSTVTITCAPIGTYCNAYQVTSSSSSRLTPSASTFTGGVDNVAFTLNGVRYEQGALWSKQATSSDTAVSISSAIALNDPSGLFSSAMTIGSTVTITVISTGVTGNSYTLSTSSSNILSVNLSSFSTSGLFSGGVNETLVYVGTMTYTQGTDWTAATTATGTAKAISDAIVAGMGSIVSSTWTLIGSNSFGLVSATVTAPGAAGNSVQFTTNKSTMIVGSKGSFINGSDSIVMSNVFTKASHNFTTGLQLLYTKTTGTDPQNLIANTTYYAIRLGANTFSLATTLTTAKAGTAIAISTVTGGGSFALTPVVIAGTPSFKWEISNDNSSWATYSTSASNVTVSSVTVSAYTAGGASTAWDFGPINYRFIRANVVAPTQGGLSLVIGCFGKASGN